MIAYMIDAVHSPELTIYPHAVRIRPLGSYPQKSTSLANLRGRQSGDKIRGFTAHSLARLRQALCVADHREPSLCYGVCLTIPWGRPGEPGCPGQDVASEVWRDFQHNLSRLVDWLRLGAIYRVELQIRGTTHWHLVVWLPLSLDLEALKARYIKLHMSRPWNKLPCSMSLNPPRLSNGHAMIDTVDADISRTLQETHALALHLLRMAWMRSCALVHSRHPDAAPVRSWGYCVQASPCRDMSAAYSYLASHSSKHKQEQLGYQGKQWGYIGRKWLTEHRGADVAGFGPNLCNHQRAVGFRLIRSWIAKHRSRSLSLLVTPRRRLVGDGYVLYTGLSVRNSRYINLFGVPPSVILHALDIGAASPCRLARGMFHVEHSYNKCKKSV